MQSFALRLIGSAASGQWDSPQGLIEVFVSWSEYLSYQKVI